ncbi:MAG: DUF4398 domain-containing protein [Myxococcales bacterium]|nr:DUF4398 domain-containing protein [Myxococcales bacterium]
MRTTTLAVAALLLGGISAGCGSYPAPSDRLTTTQAAIRGAAEVGAGQVPRAALHLKLAEEQTEKAKVLMQDGYNERAELTLRRAQADAELAIMISKEHQQVEAAKAAQEKVQKMRAELQKGTRK